ncbi:hypothetical protein CANINC_002744 [Pichia inconspicua]|uniref:Checkpoint protein n=1 Tax=Pichia inconspicua TaxID=52247 RepID=A0A4T0X0E3_9ASCO|nr:hypothetical protein CANINC_002744 [[Candida] inconspicua]
MLKFTQDELHIISSDREGPYVLGTIGKVNFERYDVVAHTGMIGLDLNVEPVFQILKNFEKANGRGELRMKLQRGESLDEPTNNSNSGSNNNSGSNKRKPVFLVIAYTENITSSSELSHSFMIPVNLVKRELLEIPSAPGLRDIKLILDLNDTVTSFFNRIERYRAIETLNIVTNRLGEMKVEFQDEGKRMSIKWKDNLEAYTPNDVESQNSQTSGDQDKDNDLNMIKDIIVRVNSRWWNAGSKMLELCPTLQLFIQHAGCVFSGNVYNEPSCTLSYYIAGKLIN